MIFKPSFSALVIAAVAGAALVMSAPIPTSVLPETAQLSGNVQRSPIQYGRDGEFGAPVFTRGYSRRDGSALDKVSDDDLSDAIKLMNCRMRPGCSAGGTHLLPTANQTAIQSRLQKLPGDQYAAVKDYAHEFACGAGHCEGSLEGPPMRRDGSALDKVSDDDLSDAIKLMNCRMRPGCSAGGTHLLPTANQTAIQSRLQKLPSDQYAAVKDYAHEFACGAGHCEGSLEGPPMRREEASVMYGAEVDKREESPDQVYQDAVCALPEHQNDPDCRRASRREESPDQVYHDAICALPEHQNDPDCKKSKAKRGPSGSGSRRRYVPQTQPQKRFGNAHATFFLQKGVAGACGKVHQETDLVVALPSAMYAGGKHCGRKVKINRKGGKGQSVTATVADECPTCTTSTSLDLSKGAFAKIGTKEEGQVDIDWSFTN